MTRADIKALDELGYVGFVGLLRAKRDKIVNEDDYQKAKAIYVGDGFDAAAFVKVFVFSPDSRK